MLACASSDGFLYLYQHTDDSRWEELVRLRTSTLGTNSVSWATVPQGEQGSLTQEAQNAPGGPTSNVEPAPQFGNSIRRDFIQGMGKVNGAFIVILEPEGQPLSILHSRTGVRTVVVQPE